MKKIVIVLALGIIGALGIYRWYLAPAASQQIAVVMTMNHPALDSVREAFISRIKADLPDIEVVDFNAQGNMQQANLIAAEIANSKRVMGVLAIGTLAAQTLAKAELNKPIVIAAVSDASVITSKNQAANVCGMTDSIDAQYQIKAILELLPELKSISLLYSPHEANSAAMVKKLAPQAEDKGIKVTLVGVQEAQQIMSSSMLACQKSDAVLIPLDNQLVAAMPAVIKATKDSPCPIITSNESPLHQGATIAFGVNYRQSGEEAGTIMIKILVEKRAPREIGFINPAQVELYLNQAVIKEKGIKLTIQGEV